MNEVTTGRRSKASKGTDWDRLRGMSDAKAHAAVHAESDARYERRFHPLKQTGRAIATEPIA